MSAGSGAAEVLRGVARALSAAGQAVLPEVPLANRRRADLLALDRRGTITLVEIKSCRADFVADRKWQEYLDYCDRFSPDAHAARATFRFVEVPGSRAAGAGRLLARCDEVLAAGALAARTLEGAAVPAPRAATG
jgi:hypothetical protein